MHERNRNVQYSLCHFVQEMYIDVSKRKLYALLVNEYLLKYIDPLLIMDSYNNNIAKD